MSLARPDPGQGHEISPVQTASATSSAPTSTSPSDIQSPPQPALALSEPISRPTPEEATSFLTALLDRPLRVTLKDRRTVVGLLHVIDGGGNLVLSEAEEFPSWLGDLFDVNRELELHGDREDLLRRREEVERGLQERWENGEQWDPRSEPFGGPGTGWGGRGLGLVLIKEADCTRIELVDDREQGAGQGAGEEVGAIS